MNASIRIALPALAFVFGACSRTPEPDPQSNPNKGSPLASAVGPGLTAAPGAKPPSGPARELTWDAPARFTRVDNPSSMRKATYKAKTEGTDTEAPELAVSIAGGAVEANVDRWVGQFDVAAKSTLKQTTKKVGAWDVTIVELKGTFSGGGMPGAAPQGPKPGWALLAAIVPLDADTRWFFKMTGPEASVTAARADFDALVASVRPK